jgi:hypothetical protein
VGPHVKIQQLLEVRLTVEGVGTFKAVEPLTMEVPVAPPTAVAPKARMKRRIVLSASSVCLKFTVSNTPSDIYM